MDSQSIGKKCTKMHQSRPLSVKCRRNPHSPVSTQISLGASARHGAKASFYSATTKKCLPYESFLWITVKYELVGVFSFRNFIAMWQNSLLWYIFLDSRWEAYDLESTNSQGLTSPQSGVKGGQSDWRLFTNTQRMMGLPLQRAEIRVAPF